MANAKSCSHSHLSSVGQDIVTAKSEIYIRASALISLRGYEYKVNKL
jgi:hypothetical protein